MQHQLIVIQVQMLVLQMLNHLLLLKVDIHHLTVLLKQVLVMAMNRKILQSYLKDQQTIMLHKIMIQIRLVYSELLNISPLLILFT